MNNNSCYGTFKSYTRNEEEARAVTDKERIIEFVKKIIPDDFRCGHISITFAEDDSAFITIGNRE